MYPNEIIFGMDLYSIMLLAGCLGAIIYMRIMSGKIGMANKVYNLTLLSGAAAIVGGYFLSVVTQAFYNYLETGTFEINKNTGATFYGGLVGGAAIFLLIYFGVGHFTCRNKENIGDFRKVSDCAAGAIAIAHSLGRLGCLFAGCCYGKQTDSFIGVYNEYLGYRTIPVQLFESMFLAGLFALFTVRNVRKKTYNLAIYMTFYGIWRFIIEYFRDDDRGETLVSFLSPSQLVALLMIAGGAILFFIMRKKDKKEKNIEENEYKKLEEK